MTSDSLEWFEINDFRPGIRMTPSILHPPGTARPNTTFRCRSLPDGSLGPGPRRVDEIEPPAILFSAGFVSGTADAQSAEVRIIGLFSNDPVYNAADQSAGVDQNNSEIWAAFEWWDGGYATNYRQAIWRLRRSYASYTGVAADWQQIYQRSQTATYAANVRPKRCHFGNQRSNSGTPAVPGPIVVGWVVDGMARFSPDDTAPSTTSTAAMPTTTGVSPDSVVMHQNRAVIFPLVPIAANANTVYATNEAFYWTEPNDLTSLDALLTSYVNTVAAPENPSGYQVMEPVTANELLLIKSKGGGLILAGDLNDFTARYLPYLRSPGLSMNRGTTTPIGFIYPIDNGGVYLWTGGDTSDDLSPYMDDNFWRPPTTIPVETRTGFTSRIPAAWGYGFTSMIACGTIVICPNNWIFDTETRAWWKLEAYSTEADLKYMTHHVTTDWSNRRFYTAPSGYFPPAAGSVALNEYDTTLGTIDYQWESHPIAPSVDRDINVREVVLTASGTTASTITVTVASTLAGGDSNTATFAFPAGDAPVSLRMPIHVSGPALTIKVAAAGNSSTTAPRVHKIAVGWMEDTSLPRSA